MTTPLGGGYVMLSMLLPFWATHSPQAPPGVRLALKGPPEITAGEDLRLTALLTNGSHETLQVPTQPVLGAIQRSLPFDRSGASPRLWIDREGAGIPSIGRLEAGSLGILDATLPVRVRVLPGRQLRLTITVPRNHLAGLSPGRYEAVLRLGGSGGEHCPRCPAVESATLPFVTYDSADYRAARRLPIRADFEFESDRLTFAFTQPHRRPGPIIDRTFSPSLNVSGVP